MGKAIESVIDSDRYARCIAASKRVRWDIDEDVIRGRELDRQLKFLPDSLSMVDELTFLFEREKRFLGQVQGRTYANIFGLVERFICAKVMEVSNDYALGDQVALEALVRFSDEEIKHQELFRRLDLMASRMMPDGYVFAPDPNEVAEVVLGKSTWAVLALTLHIELFTQAHYRQSIDSDDSLSPLWKDVFLYHWQEESQHAILDELEWQRENDRISDEVRDRAVDEFIELVAAVDGILQAQAEQDAQYFANHCRRYLAEAEVEKVHAGLLKAYRWQYIFSGVQTTRFTEVLMGQINEAQAKRVTDALETMAA